MKEVTYQVNVNTKNAVKGVDNLNESLETTNKEVGGLKTSGKALESLKKGAKGVAGGFKTMGTALKASGVGLALAAFATLKELFEQNQKVVDIFNIAFESLAIAFNDFFNYLNDNVGTIIGYFKSIFDDPLGSLKAFGVAIKENIIERFNSALEVLGYLGTAIKKVFEGDFDGAMEAAKNAGKEYVDVLTGVDNSVEKITEVVSEGVTALTDYTKSTVEAATANVELKKQADLAAVANQGLIEKYDLQAEQLRQIRDEERNSIEDRKKANDELGIVLEQQEKAMLENAQISLRAAQAELKKDKDNIESKKAVMEAENELAAVRAQVAGFRSEQLANDLALSREELEMTNTKLESEANLSIERKRFNAEQLTDESERLLELQRIDAEEAELQTTRLQAVIDNANAGTQAKIDAQIALDEFLEQSRQQQVSRSNELAALELANKDKLDAKDKEISENEKILNQQKVQGVMNTLETIANISALFAGESEKEQKKAFEIQKAVSIAQTLISTAQSAIDSYKSLSGIPVVGPALGFAASAAAVTAGLAQVKQIKDQKFDGGGSTSPSPVSSGGGGASATQAPSFNVVGQSGFNQIAGALGQQPPAQAFVVAGDVTTAQQLQNNTIQQATF